MQPQYIDISAANQPLSDWHAYKQWSAQADGMSPVAIKLTEGTGYVSLANHAAQAQANGIDSIIWYHYARPERNPGWQGAQSEVNFFKSHLPAMRASDYVMLDYEGFPGEADTAWLPDWAWDWLHLFSEDASIAANRVSLYSYQNFIARKLQYEPLAGFPLILAQYNASKSDTPVPAIPAPWKTALAWQFSNHQQVPGVVGFVGCNLWLAAPPVHPPTVDIPGAITDLKSALAKLGG
jgi:GH25 family lysozyme M1 (1,4-beta-N-acetylmuramidase)